MPSRVGRGPGPFGQISVGWWCSCGARTGCLRVIPCGVNLLQLFFEFWGCDLAVDRPTEKQGDLFDLSGLFVDEFESVLVDPGGAPALQMGAGVLCFGSKDGVATANIGQNRVDTSGAVAAAPLWSVRKDGRSLCSWCLWTESGRRRSARCGRRAGAGRRSPPNVSGPMQWARSVICAALRSWAGVIRCTPRRQEGLCAQRIGCVEAEVPSQGGWLGGGSQGVQQAG
jgi:hypothetical protein